MPKNDRINISARDQGANIMSQTKDVASLGDHVGQIYQKVENDKIEQISNKAEADYSTWNNSELERIKKLEGDPTAAYVEYEKNAQTKREEILAGYSDVNDRVKRHVTARLDKTVTTQRIGADKQRGAQQETYANNNYEATVKLRKDNIPVAAGYVRAGDPSSFEMVDRGLNDMKDLIVKRGLITGTVTELPDDAKTYTHTIKEPDEMTADGVLVEGRVIKVSMSNLAKQRFAKESSESIKNSIEVLVASGKVEEAKEMQEKYKTYIDPVSAAKLDKKFKAAGRKDEAYSIIGNLRGKSDEAQIQAIDSIKDPEVRSEALKIKEADDRRLTHLRDRKAKANYEKLADQVMQKMNSPQPYFGEADLENDPLYKQTWDNLKPSQKKVISEMVNSPKESNPKSLSSAYKLLADPDYMEGADIGDFMEKISGLSKVDRNRVMKEFNKLNNPSADAERQTYKRADQLVKKYLISSGAVDADENEVITEQQAKMYDFLSRQKTLPNEEQLQKYAKELAAEDIDNKVFKSKFAPKKKPSQTTQTVNTISAKSINVDTIDPDTLWNLKNEYAGSNSGRLPNKKDPKFIKWLESRG